MSYIPIHKDDKIINQLEEAVNKNEELSSWELFSMAYEAAKTTIASSFEGLHATQYLTHIMFSNYQVQTAEQVIENMNGRAILADEVGLGKTIEAGLILKEYMIRGLVKKALILVPASLVNQW